MKLNSCSHVQVCMLRMFRSETSMLCVNCIDIKPSERLERVWSRQQGRWSVKGPDTFRLSSSQSVRAIVSLCLARKYLCLCRFSFKLSLISIFTFQIIVIDLEIIDFKCQYCDKVFIDEKTMKVHQEKKQKGEKTGCKINYLRNLRSESSKGSVGMVSSALVPT